MKIIAEIFVGKEKKVVEIVKEGNNTAKVLISFMNAIRKYAKKENKILKIKSDDATVLSYFAEHSKVVVESLTP